MQVKNIEECSKGEHSAILKTFIKLRFVIKILVLSIFEWPLKTGFTVHKGLTKMVVKQTWNFEAAFTDGGNVFLFGSMKCQNRVWEFFSSKLLQSISTFPNIKQYIK